MRWKIILALAALVLVCLAAGIIIGRELKRAEYRHRNRPQAWNVEAMRTLKKRLTLTPEQEAQVQGIMDRGVPDLLTVRDEAKNRANVIVDRMIAEMEPHLTEAQRAEFTKLKSERDHSSLDALYVSPPKK